MIMHAHPKIYHIVHVDRLNSIIKDGHLWCDAKMAQLPLSGSTIGMPHIKKRRLEVNTLKNSHPNLYVGQCVPFYFCPRSIMLYMIHQANHEGLIYRGGQEPILHLEADMHQAVKWANKNNKRWAFTLSNASARYFEDYCDLLHLDKINWLAVNSTRWGGADISPSISEGKQAEFLMEDSFPWFLIERIGVSSDQIYHQVSNIVNTSQPLPIEVKRDWYY